ncbi:hypothetical protein ACLOJK_019010 [Asimina triloba]
MGCLLVIKWPHYARCLVADSDGPSITSSYHDTRFGDVPPTSMIVMGSIYKPRNAMDMDFRCLNFCYRSEETRMEMSSSLDVVVDEEEMGSVANRKWWRRGARIIIGRRRCCSDGEEMVMGFMVGSHGYHWGRRGSRCHYHCFHSDGVASSVQLRRDLNWVAIVVLLIGLDLLIGALICQIWKTHCRWSGDVVGSVGEDGVVGGFTDRALPEKLIADNHGCRPKGGRWSTVTGAPAVH